MTRVETTRKMTMMSRNSAIPWIRSFWAILASPESCVMPLSCESDSWVENLSWTVTDWVCCGRFVFHWWQNWTDSTVRRKRAEETSVFDIFGANTCSNWLQKDNQDKEAAASGFPERMCVSVMFYAGNAHLVNVSESERDKQCLIRQIVLQHCIQDLGLQFAFQDTN